MKGTGSDAEEGRGPASATLTASISCAGSGRRNLTDGPAHLQDQVRLGCPAAILFTAVPVADNVVMKIKGEYSRPTPVCPVYCGHVC